MPGPGAAAAGHAASQFGSKLHAPFTNKIGYKSSGTASKDSTTLGFNGIDPSGKVDQKMLATNPTAKDQEQVKKMTENMPKPAEVKGFLSKGTEREMKRAIAIVALVAIPAALLNAQFGGLKEKIDGATGKAKPVTDRADRAAQNYKEWTPQEEQQVGEATAAKMIAMFGVVDAPKLVHYVNLVGQSVAQYAPRQVPYRFGVLDSEIVGAFALPGGFIFITKTAIEGMNNEAQLAGALGHEIVHVSERHLEAAIRGKKNSAWATEEAKSKAGSAPNPLGNNDYLMKQASSFINDMFNMRQLLTRKTALTNAAR